MARDLFASHYSEYGSHENLASSRLSQTIQSSGGVTLFLLAAVLMSISAISVAIFACGRSSSQDRQKKGGRGAGTNYAVYQDYGNSGADGQHGHGDGGGNCGGDGGDGGGGGGCGGRGCGGGGHT